MSDKKFELSRRNALIGLGTVGLASAGAGVGTSAYFSDEESFEDNTLTAGELDLFVDYWTGANSEAIDGGTTGSGQNDGGVSAQYVLNDVKPGDSGKLVFCPKIVDNPAWLWAGSSGFTQYENDLTEPEAEVDDTGGDPGAGNGELADNIQVTVAYCEPSDDLEGSDPSGPEDFETVRELNNPEDYTLTDLLLELQYGYLLDGYVEEGGEWVPTDDGAYPASPDSDTQTGPCICIEWNVPTTVGNVIQSDSVEFDLGFYAEQERHNENPTSPYATGTTDDLYPPFDSNRALGMSIQGSGGSGSAEAEIHNATSGNTAFPFGNANDDSDNFPADQDVDFTATLDVDSNTASLEVLGSQAGGTDVTASDTDVTDGQGDGNALGSDTEWQNGGIPQTVDVAISARSLNSDTTTVKNLTLNGTSVSPDQLAASAGPEQTYLVLQGIDSSAGNTIEIDGTLNIEGDASGWSGIDGLVINWR
ncbi:SipW-dependent-type signal peptide-containing protein [Halorubrum sp. CBA1229]|uniref:SipW-dependent-type signal peptide-containing protein n=1 Tax=Halorubrum sp. CBA1229 TaxID=1853699 RepID=UPI000F418859|nr:SipW-dependent-type signal peptide-containing protein [Halorubrum sp. CBA1229]QKY18071.1 hypothetical protein Hrr1229_014725 [Halorubrum sp. CBA1229]